MNKRSVWKMKRKGQGEMLWNKQWSDWGVQISTMMEVNYRDLGSLTENRTEMEIAELLFPTMFCEWTRTLKGMDPFYHKKNFASSYWGQYCFTLEIYNPDLHNCLKRILCFVNEKTGNRLHEIFDWHSSHMPQFIKYPAGGVHGKAQFFPHNR